MTLPRNLTTEQVAEFLNCTTDQVRKLIRRGKIKATKEYGDWAIPADRFLRDFNASVNRPKENEVRP